MFITPIEIFDIILMTFVVGFVFMDVFKPQKKVVTDVLEKYLKKSKGFDWHSFWFAAMVTAPAIILHELGHKITALSFGLTAVFNAAYVWLGVAILLKLIGSSFIFFVPAFVRISGNATSAQQSIIAFAGPAVNLIIFIVALIILKTTKNLSMKTIQFLQLTKSISLFLFIFNMIPIPGFDGFTVFKNLGILTGLWH
ncbi:MAG: metalloprotease [Candidatus Woesearchaeota archaeon]